MSYETAEQIQRRDWRRDPCLGDLQDGPREKVTLGLIYVAVNEDFVGYCKIGCTIRDAGIRLREIKSQYGTRKHWTESSRHLVPYHYAVEALVHRKLADRRVKGTEVFRCAPTEARATILCAADEIRRNPPQFQPRPKRAPTRRRRARRWWTPELALAAFSVVLVALIILWKPPLPDWLPAPAARTVAWVESWHWPISK